MTTTGPTSAETSVQNARPVHVCLLGPSGIGKAPLALLFRLPGLDPLRVREPRDEKDKLVCISEPDAAALFAKATADKPVPWPTPKAPANWFVLGKHWLFFGVRGDRQCLRFEEDDGRRPVLRSQKRVEVFAPRLLDILNNRDGVQGKISLSPDDLVVLLLNPSQTSYDDMTTGPDEDLKQATFYAITKRTELQSRPVDIPDAQRRVSRIADELTAWNDIKKLVGKSCLEFRSWKHFEFRYHQPDGSPADARRELLSARDVVLAKLYEASGSSPVVQRFLDSDVVLSPAEILQLNDIV